MKDFFSKIKIPRNVFSFSLVLSKINILNHRDYLFLQVEAQVPSSAQGAAPPVPAGQAAAVPPAMEIDPESQRETPRSRDPRRPQWGPASRVLGAIGHRRLEFAAPAQDAAEAHENVEARPMEVKY